MSIRNVELVQHSWGIFIHIIKNTSCDVGDGKLKAHWIQASRYSQQRIIFEKLVRDFGDAQILNKCDRFMWLRDDPGFEIVT